MMRRSLHDLALHSTAGGHWSAFVIWAKNGFTLGRADYQRQYEPILYGWKEGDDHFWCGAQDQGDVWFVDKPRKNDLHPTMKPVALVERAVRNSSKSRDIVLDPFGGSGTTLIACEKTGRSARLVALRTECFCQPVASTICSIVAPSGYRSMAIRVACLAPLRDLRGCFGLWQRP